MTRSTKQRSFFGSRGSGVQTSPPRFSTPQYHKSILDNGTFSDIARYRFLRDFYALSMQSTRKKSGMDGFGLT